MISARIADRYVLLAPLGSGGEARVFRAHDEKQNCEVAVRLALGPVASVLDAAPTQSHEHWVLFFDSGIDPQHGAYQVFELLEGQTLAALIQSAPLTPEAWREFVGHSLDAVEAVHQANWVHGDLNADNFFRTAAGWKLLELPFHRFEMAAARSAMFGSIYTLAPEQIDGAKPSVRSDLYALGCLYYYAASGQWPHTGQTVQEVAISSLLHRPKELREAALTLPAAWSDWVMKLIVPKPGDRFSSVATARQLLADAVA
jgi:serine/threonine protein kinase